jgi:RimJ/RimL family protein N-acetyltransferase
MGEPKIETARLRLIAANPVLLAADLAGVDHLCAALGANRPMEWPPDGSGYDEAAIRFFLEMLSTGGERAAGWYSWYAVSRPAPDHATELVGAGGFFGPPDNDGSVQIGYSVCKEWRRVGIATEIVEALLTYAWMNDAVRKILARTRPDNCSSIGVLRRNGFQETACVEPEMMQFERLRNHTKDCSRI